MESMSPTASPRRGPEPMEDEVDSSGVLDEGEPAPSFVIYESSDWFKRMLSLERFRSLARLVLVRVRLKRRLERIRTVCRHAKWQKDKVAQAAMELLARGAQQQQKKPKKVRLWGNRAGAPRCMPDRDRLTAGRAQADRVQG